MRNRPEWTLARTRILWQFPALIMVAIYLPAAVLGAFKFHDAYAVTVLILLGLFVAIYYGLYPPFARFLGQTEWRSWMWKLGARINWPACAGAAVVAYVATIAFAAGTVPATPLSTALQGGSVYDIAASRADFLVNRTGTEALLRYSAVILGRTVMPFLVAYAYWSGHRARHVALVSLLFFYLVPLEKASPIFAFLPLIVLRSLQQNWKASLAHVASLFACIALWTLLAMGSLHEPNRGRTGDLAPVEQIEKHTAAPVQTPLVQRHGDPRRHYIFYALDNPRLHQSGESPVLDQFLWIVNRMTWSPYVTAYDWLRFHDDILNGELTLGRQIGILSWLMGKPRLRLEPMVYQYQYGASPGGGGASNTVFLVDAKVAFGWPGVVAYCVAFTLFAAIVFTSANPVAQVASVTSFFTATLSPLTATLLSGGLFFYLAISLLTRLRFNEKPAEQYSP